MPSRACPAGERYKIEPVNRLLLISRDLTDTVKIRNMLNESQNAKFEIERVTTLRAALNRLTEHPYDVIISDLDLPDSPRDETAFELCRAAPEIPLLVLDDQENEKLEISAIKSGAQDFLVKKKLDSELLGRAIRHSIERKHLDWQLRLARFRLSILHDTAAELGSCNMKKDAYRTAIEAAGKLAGEAVFQILQSKDGVLVSVAASSQLSDRIGKRVKIDPGLIGMVFSEKRTMRFSSLDDTGIADPDSVPYISGLAIPLGSEAVLQVLSKNPDAFSDEETSMLEMLCGHLRGTIERISLERQLRSLAIHDPLTGAFNRNFFQAALNREMLRAKRYSSNIGFLIVDIDNFKQINDQWGHQTGDQILKEVSEFLGSSIRETDYLIRYGGDEFLLILIETGQTAILVRERILSDPSLAASTVNLIGTPVTLSIGSSHWNPETGMSIQETLAEADRGMYRHKRSKQEG